MEPVHRRNRKELFRELAKITRGPPAGALRVDPAHPPDPVPYGPHQPIPRIFSRSANMRVESRRGRTRDPSESRHVTGTSAIL